MKELREDVSTAFVTSDPLTIVILFCIARKRSTRNIRERGNKKKRGRNEHGRRKKNKQRTPR